ncbi:MAG: hypothetical protein ACR2QX_01055 [Woeseiaceae bacterium]
MIRAYLICLVLLATACESMGPTEDPCGGTEPLGCSIPDAVRVLSDDLLQQANKFHDACVLHDLCYRYGYATYDLSREDCDTEFYTEMKAACSGYGGLGMLDPEEFAKCQLAANQTYEAVREHGEKHFKTSPIAVCEYR